MDNLPRTLVVTEAPFGLNNGFGVTLNTFFSGWDTERLFVLYTRQETAAPSEQNGRSAFANVPGHWGRRYGAAFLLGRRPTWRGRYSAWWLRQTLGSWRPEVVYTMVFSGETLAFATWIARHYGAPLVAHVADDGLEHQRGGVSASTQELLAGAAARISISEEMRQEYSNRYGVDSHVLHNGAADALFSPTVASPHDDFVVRYLGSIVPGHHFNAIEDVASAVRSLAAAGLPVRFELCGGHWTREHARTLTDDRAVVYIGEVDKAAGFELLKTADLLVIPVSFDRASFSQIRLSLPTKLVECLATGTPTLVYGPAGAAPIDFCRRHGVGSVIDERSNERVATFIRGMLSDRNASRSAAMRDQVFIQQNHTAKQARDAFRAVLRHAAGVTC